MAAKTGLINMAWHYLRLQYWNSDTGTVGVREYFLPVSAELTFLRRRRQTLC